jgi:hypothetical protein
MKQNTTAENMAKLVVKIGPEWLAEKEDTKAFIECVEVQETETGSAIAEAYDNDDILI